MKTGLFGLGTAALILSVLMSGVLLAPNNASAFWWSWGDRHAHAQGSDNDNDDVVSVIVQKYVDGQPATDDRANGQSFSMTASWNDPEAGEGSGSYTLSSDNEYMAATSEMNKGADYTTEETIDGDIVAATCEDASYRLVGYSTGDSAEAAASAEVTSDVPSFTDLSNDMYVIVWNETCGDDVNPTPGEGTLTGNVTGGQSDQEPGNLEVTAIDAQKTTAIANGTFEDGWQYVFHITVPTDEPELALKFADWMQTNGTHVLPVADNMRISSDQANNDGATVLLTGADTYSTPNLTMTNDLDENEDGLQVQVLVEVAVPSDTYNGTYSTEYGVRTLP